MYHKHEDSKKNECNGTTESIKLDKINNDVDLDDSKTSPTKSINDCSKHINSRQSSKMKLSQKSTNSLISKKNNKSDINMNKLIKKNNDNLIVSKSSTQLKAFTNKQKDSEFYNNFISKIKTKVKNANSPVVKSSPKFIQNNSYYKVKEDVGQNLPSIKPGVVAVSANDNYQSDLKNLTPLQHNRIEDKKYMKQQGSSCMLSSIYSQSHTSSGEMKSRNVNDELGIKIDPKSKFTKNEDETKQLIDRYKNSDTGYTQINTQNQLDIDENVNSKPTQNHFITALGILIGENKNEEDNKINQDKMNRDLSIENLAETQTNRMQNLYRMSIRFIEDKFKLPLISHRNSHDQVYSLPKKHKIKRSKKRKVDPYSAYMTKSDWNKTCKLKAIKSVSPIKRSIKYDKIVKPRHPLKFEKYITSKGVSS